jgi:hypothetical protein
MRRPATCVIFETGFPIFLGLAGRQVGWVLEKRWSLMGVSSWAGGNDDGTGLSARQLVQRQSIYWLEHRSGFTDAL